MASACQAHNLLRDLISELSPSGLCSRITVTIADEQGSVTLSVDLLECQDMVDFEGIDQ